MLFSYLWSWGERGEANQQEMTGQQWRAGGWFIWQITEERWIMWAFFIFCEDEVWTASKWCWAMWRCCWWSKFKCVFAWAVSRLLQAAGSLKGRSWWRLSEREVEIKKQQQQKQKTVEYIFPTQIISPRICLHRCISQFGSHSTDPSLFIPLRLTLLTFSLSGWLSWTQNSLQFSFYNPCDKSCHYLPYGFNEHLWNVSNNLFFSLNM